MYRLTNDPDLVIYNGVAWIPRGHRWWAAYEQWLAEGNTPDPADETLIE